MRAFFSHRSLVALFILLVATICKAQEYYVIIGSFANESGAKKYVGYAKTLRFDAEYRLNNSKKLYYVFVLRTADRAQAIQQTRELQQGSEFSDAWMFTDTEGVLSGSSPAIQKQTPITPPPIVTEEKKQPAKEPMEVKPLPPAEEKKPEPESPPAVEEKKAEAAVPEKRVVRGKLFKFVLQTEDGRQVPGKVYNVDKQARRDLAAYEANSYADVLRPSVQGTPMTIVAEIFGYSEEVRLIDYSDPSNTKGTYQDENGAWVIPIQLTRLRKGEVSVMYNVSFYKDAVIMTPNSKRDLDDLVTLMKMNPNYRIKVHSHNNGNEKNLRIIQLGSDKNYFNMARSLSRMGNAKQLTEERAETIKMYLVDNGIDKNRIETQGWGGLVMMVAPGTSSAARMNNRIEIEILED